MSEIITTVIGGLIVAFIAALLGWSGGRSTVVQGVRVKRTGKIIIIVSVLMILGGLAWADTNQLYGLTLAGYGLLFLIIGKIVAWFQRL